MRSFQSLLIAFVVSALSVAQPPAGETKQQKIQNKRAEKYLLSLPEVKSILSDYNSSDGDEWGSSSLVDFTFRRFSCVKRDSRCELKFDMVLRQDVFASDTKNEQFQVEVSESQVLMPASCVIPKITQKTDVLNEKLLGQGVTILSDAFGERLNDCIAKAEVEAVKKLKADGKLKN